MNTFLKIFLIAMMGSLATSNLECATAWGLKSSITSIEAKVSMLLIAIKNTEEAIKKIQDDLNKIKSPIDDTTVVTHNNNIDELCKPLNIPVLYEEIAGF